MENLPETKVEDIEYLVENVKSWKPEDTRTIVEALSFLTTKLEGNLADYDTVISDDVSARLLALFFTNIINRKKEEKKLEPVNTFFLTPKRGRFEKINEGIYNFIAGKDIKKALVVTEHIDSGISLKPIVKALTGNNIVYDIASISKTGFFVLNVLNPTIRALSRNLTYYYKGSDGLLFHKNRVNSGVYKESTDIESIHPSKLTLPPKLREEVNQARKDISLIADYVYSKLELASSTAPNHTCH